MAKDDNIHINHRSRMRECFKKTKLQGMSDIQILEMLLYYFIPYKDTNPIAHALLRQFGSIQNALSADVVELKRVKNIGEVAAVGMNFVYELFRRFMEPTNDQLAFSFDSLNYIIQFLESKLLYLREEEFHAILFDSRYRILKYVFLSKGTPTTTQIEMRKLMSEVLLHKASKVVVAHNHPSRDPRPSKDDHAATEFIFTFLHYLGVELTDSVIIADRNKYFSFRKEKIFDKFFLFGDPQRRMVKNPTISNFDEIYSQVSIDGINNQISNNDAINYQIPDNEDKES